MARGNLRNNDIIFRFHLVTISAEMIIPMVIPSSFSLVIMANSLISGRVFQCLSLAQKAICSIGSYSVLVLPDAGH